MKLKYLPLVPMSRVGLICLEQEVEDREYYVILHNITNNECSLNKDTPEQEALHKWSWKKRVGDVCWIMSDVKTLKMNPESGFEKRYIPEPVTQYQVLIIEGPTE